MVPGISVDLANGNDPHIVGDNKRDFQVKYTDIQDVVNLLWSSGAESVSVNNQRVVASSSFFVAGTDVLLNGTHLTPPYHIEAIGDGNAFNQALSDSGNLAHGGFLFAGGRPSGDSVSPKKGEHA